MPVIQTRFAQARSIFQRRGGLLRMHEAINLGIDRNVLYTMLKEGAVERLSRGLYRLTDLPPMSNPDLVTVSRKIPTGVICLISALFFHEITSHIPHEVQLAILRRTEPPRVDYPPIRAFIFSEQSFKTGVVTHHIDGVDVRIYSPAKTVADCFKYRNKIGFDVAMEALKMYYNRRDFNLNELMEYARKCRVYNVMRPYVEALL
ncbi:MAG: type IV toxin-antitoxin system AbiEi family antitoxin domain-containing protein [Candidatus Hatepunaea meridiana]|nr:type IV toxin-antitoxin system AbiEi family antitoxin domain-containing protein [Candidatus Hatepunaea meridiana]